MHFDVPLANQADPLVRLVSKRMALSADAEDYLRIWFNGSAQNVVDHAKSKIGGVWCARSLHSSATVRIAIVDRGLGIPATVRASHPETRSDEEALLRVRDGGLSAKSLARNMGLGVSNLTSRVLRLRGEVVLLSGGACVQAMPAAAPRSFPMGEARFPGTAVLFKLRVSGGDL